jgi:hypothetical protein
LLNLAKQTKFTQAIYSILHNNIQKKEQDHLIIEWNTKTKSRTPRFLQSFSLLPMEEVVATKLLQALQEQMEWKQDEQ